MDTIRQILADIVTIRERRLERARRLLQPSHAVTPDEVDLLEIDVLLARLELLKWEQEA